MVPPVTVVPPIELVKEAPLLMGSVPVKVMPLLLPLFTLQLMMPVVFVPFKVTAWLAVPVKLMAMDPVLVCEIIPADWLNVPVTFRVMVVEAVALVSAPPLCV